MTTQISNGPGDNVGGNKYENIIRSVQTHDLKSVIDSIMLDICYRDINIAEEKLKILKQINSIESDVKSLLNALEVKIEVTQGNTFPEKKELLGFLQNSSLPTGVREVVTSILLDLEYRTNPIIARERYNSLDTKGAYIEEVFFEKLASKEEIKNCFDSDLKFNLLDCELAGLIRGALRLQDFSLSVNISLYLNASFPSKNSKSLLLYSESCLIVTQNNDKHYLSLDKAIKENIDRLVLQLSAYLDEGEDRRYIYALMNLLNLTYFMDCKLIDLANKYIERIHAVDEGYAAKIKQGPMNNSFNLTSDILDMEGFVKLNIALDTNQIQLSTVKTWLKSGGVIQTGDNYFNSFSELLLSSLLCEDNDKQEVELLNKKAQEFYELDVIKFSNLNPLTIIILCDRFIELGLCIHAIAYLRPFIASNAWVSPLFECYLSALFHGEKYGLFLPLLELINTEDKTELIWLLEAQLYSRTKKTDLSIKAVRAAINISPKNPSSWHLLLSILRNTGASEQTLKDTVLEIPEYIFSTFHESKLLLMNEIASFIDLNLADRVLVDWFAKNPDKMAIPLTTIHTNSLLNRAKVTTNPYIPLHCCDGVTYSDGFDTFTKILVKGVDVNNSSLLDIESPTGKLFDGLKEGASIQEVTLIERLSPYVAAFRLASKLRHNSNDGTDIFKMFTMPSNNEDFVPYIKKILKRYSPEAINKKSVLENPDLPVVMKGHYTNPDNPVKGAIAHITSKESAQLMRLFNQGEETPRKVIVDAYTAVYFSLIGLVSGFEELSIEIVLSKQTKFSLEQWLGDILREDYLSLDLTDKGIRRYTAENIKRDSSDFIQELQKLLTLSKVEDLKLSDTPDNLLRIKDVIDRTVYSTFQLSIANDIPWLCVDHIMCSIAYRSNYLVVNINSLLIKMLESTSLENKKKGIQLSLFQGTPVPILYTDIINLSDSPKNKDVHMVACFLKKHPVSFDSPDVSLSFLVTVTYKVTVNAFFEGTILNGGVHNPCYDGYAEHAFNLCCRNAINVLKGKTAEERLALLIYNVLQNGLRNKRYVIFILNLTTAFAKGHFLDIQEVSNAIDAISIQADK